jgi:hypothetical protein
VIDALAFETFFPAEKAEEVLANEVLKATYLAKQK